MSLTPSRCFVEQLCPNVIADKIGEWCFLLGVEMPIPDEIFCKSFPQKVARKKGPGLSWLSWQFSKLAAFFEILMFTRDNTHKAVMVENTSVLSGCFRYGSNGSELDLVYLSHTAFIERDVNDQIYLFPETKSRLVCSSVTWSTQNHVFFSLPTRKIIETVVLFVMPQYEWVPIEIFYIIFSFIPEWNEIACEDYTKIAKIFYALVVTDFSSGLPPNNVIDTMYNIYKAIDS